MVVKRGNSVFTGIIMRAQNRRYTKSFSLCVFCILCVHIIDCDPIVHLRAVNDYITAEECVLTNAMVFNVFLWNAFALAN